MSDRTEDLSESLPDRTIPDSSLDQPVDADKKTPDDVTQRLTEEDNPDAPSQAEDETDQTLMLPSDPGSFQSDVLSGDDSSVVDDQTMIQNRRPVESNPTSVQRSFEPPKLTVEGYEILGELGRGGMGIVHKARQTKLQRIVALKMILSGGMSSRAQLERFQLEAEVIAKLQHPNIVQIFDIGQHQGMPFFSLEYVEGGSLTDRLRESLPTHETSARILIALAEAMDCAHCQGIIHRDLKPGNVLLAGTPETPLEECAPKITDFGLARELDDSSDKTREGSVLGTPSYMPPEQAEGRTWQLGPPADIYSLGAILYDLLTGRPPFRGDTVVETLQQVISLEPRPPMEMSPLIPRDLQTICLKCLEKDPAARYRSCQELAEDLQAFLDGRPIKARPAFFIERAWKWIHRHPTVALLILVSFLAIIGFGVGGILFARQSADLAEANAHRASIAEAAAKNEAVLRGKEEQQRARAELNLSQARGLVQELTRLTHERLAREPHLDHILKDLLALPLKHNQAFIEGNGNRPDLRHDLAMAHFRVGEIEEMLGKSRAAENAYRQAIALLETEKQQHPSKPELRQDLAAAFNDLAIVQMSIAKATPKEVDRSALLDQAASTFAKAIAIKKKLTDEFPEKQFYLLDLVESRNNRGHLWLLRGDDAKAQADYQQALLDLKQLPKAQHLETLARTSNHLGIVQARLGAKTTTESFGTSVRSWRELVGNDPSNPDYRHGLANALRNRGRWQHGVTVQYLDQVDTMLQQEKPNEAEARKIAKKAQLSTAEAQTDYQQSRKILTPLVKEHPSTVKYQVELGELLFNFGQLTQETQQFRESATIWEASAAAWQRLAMLVPNEPFYRQREGISRDELALAMREIKDFEGAKEQWAKGNRVLEDLVGDAPTDSHWSSLLRSYNNLLVTEIQLGALLRAEKICQKYVSLQEQRNKLLSGVALYESDLAMAQLTWASLLSKQGKETEAKAALTKAIQWQQLAHRKSPRKDFQGSLVDCYAVLIELHLETGSHQQASATLEQLLKTVPPNNNDPTTLSTKDAAAYFNQCAEKAAMDSKLKATDRDRVVNDYRKRAKALLAQQ